MPTMVRLMFHPSPPFPKPVTNPPYESIDYEKFSFPHAQKPYLEFPILENGTFDGNEGPGADRIVCSCYHKFRIMSAKMV
jgi:hypothetical protein